METGLLLLFGVVSTVDVPVSVSFVDDPVPVAGGASDAVFMDGYFFDGPQIPGQVWWLD